LKRGSKRRAEINGDRRQFVVLLSEFHDLMTFAAGEAP